MKIKKLNVIGNCEFCNISNTKGEKIIYDLNQPISIPTPMEVLYRIKYYKSVYILCKGCIKAVKEFIELKRGGMKITDEIRDELLNNQ